MIIEHLPNFCQSMWPFTSNLTWKAQANIQQSTDSYFMLLIKIIFLHFFLLGYIELGFMKNTQSFWISQNRKYINIYGPIILENKNSRNFDVLRLKSKTS